MDNFITFFFAIVVIVAFVIAFLGSRSKPVSLPKPEEKPEKPPVESTGEVIEKPTIEVKEDKPEDIPVEKVYPKFWYKIWKMSQGNPPDAMMKRALSDKEYKYYTKHKSEFGPGTPQLADKKGKTL